MVFCLDQDKQGLHQEGVQEKVFLIISPLVRAAAFVKPT